MWLDQKGFAQKEALQKIRSEIGANSSRLAKFFEDSLEKSVNVILSVSWIKRFKPGVLQNLITLKAWCTSNDYRSTFFFQIFYDICFYQCFVFTLFLPV